MARLESATMTPNTPNTDEYGNAIQPKVRRDAKLKIKELFISDGDYSRVTFEFNRPLTPLEFQGLATTIRQAIAS